MIILVKFENFQPLECEINDTDIGRKYFQLVKKNYSISKPIYRDINRYTFDYLQYLAQQANKEFGWRWDLSNGLAPDIMPLLHKDIEVLLKNGFEKVPAEYDELLHEIHYCLHLIDTYKNLDKATSWLQIEWFNDDAIELPQEFKFSDVFKFGELRLQNPFVGHGPLQMWLEQDFTNISQTCKFHTVIKPGINIAIKDHKRIDFTDKIIEKFKASDPEFVNMHGEEKIKHYTGYPVIGKVKNLDILNEIILSPKLIFESMDFA